MVDAAADPVGKSIVQSVVNDIVDMHYRGDVRGIACVIVDKDGDLRTLVGYAPGTKLPLLAGLGIAHASLIGQMQPADKKLD